MAKVNTIFGFTDNVSGGIARMVRQLNSAEKGFSRLQRAAIVANNALGIIGSIYSVIGKVSGAVGGLAAGYLYQQEQEMKLETIMRQRMGASQAEIQAIKDLAAEQEKSGIYSAAMITQGAQELASFTSNRKAIEMLVPAMSDLIAQQYGYSAGGREFQATADMMGKVLSGQYGALSRMGYIFSEQEKRMLKMGTEEQKAATLAKIITDNVGYMNKALAGTDEGQILKLNNAIGPLKDSIGKTLVELNTGIRLAKFTMEADFYKAMNKALTAVAPLVKQATKAFLDFYQKARPVLIRMAKAIKDFAESVKRNAIHILAALTAVAAGLVVAGALWLAFNAKMIASTVKAVAVHGVQMAKMAVQWLIGLGPVGWIIGGIIAIVGIAIAAFIKLGLTFADVGKAIGGACGFMYAQFYNLYVRAYNLFASLAEFIANVFTDPIGSIGRLVTNFIDALLSQLQSIAPVIDFITNKNFTGALQGARSAVKDWSDKTFGKGRFTINRMEEKSVEYLTKAGMSKGEEAGMWLDKKLENLLKLNKADDSTKVDEILKGIEGVSNNFKTDSSGALLTSDENLVSIAEDWKDLLMRQATSRFNVQFASLTPSVNVGGMTINNNMDAQAVIHRISEGIMEASGSALR